METIALLLLSERISEGLVLVRQFRNFPRFFRNKWADPAKCIVARNRGSGFCREYSMKLAWGRTLDTSKNILIAPVIDRRIDKSFESVCILEIGCSVKMSPSGNVKVLKCSYCCNMNATLRVTQCARMLFKRKPLAMACETKRRAPRFQMSQPNKFCLDILESMVKVLRKSWPFKFNGACPIRGLTYATRSLYLLFCHSSVNNTGHQRIVKGLLNSFQILSCSKFQWAHGPKQQFTTVSTGKCTLPRQKICQDP